MALIVSYDVAGENQEGVGTAGWRRSNITSRSTRPRDSISFMVVLSGLLEGCSRGAGYLRRWAASHSQNG